MNRPLLAAMILLGIWSAPSAIAVDVTPPDSPLIHYAGRWDFSDRSAPWCAWQGSSIKASFQGTSIRGEFGSGDRGEFIRVVIDGDTIRSTKIQLASGRHECELAVNLEPGPHSIEIVKETYSLRDRTYFYGLLVEDGRLIPSERKPPRMRIQFYGDSNLAGHSLGHEQNKSGAALAGCFFTYAGIASRMLDADYQNISVSGAIIAGRRNSVMSFYNRMEFGSAEPPWAFERFSPDVCVVNIGANDINGKSKQQIKADYLSLLTALRKAHPKAKIVLMNGYGWDRNEPANYTDEVIEEYGDPQVSRVIFPWLFNEWHGCEYDHAGMAHWLVEHLATVNPKWTAVHSADVMNGFSLDGDVANGSFEFVAPFGGYGWRYRLEGAQRIRDSENCPDGEWFLRLPNGKQVHQPVPTAKLQKHELRLKMRGNSSDAKALIRIEFRDQQWRNEIQGTAKEFTFPLTEEWEEYSLSIQSPDSPKPSSPSHDPWQLIIRLQSAQGTVDIDDVETRVLRGEP